MRLITTMNVAGLACVRFSLSAHQDMTDNKEEAA